MRLLCPRHAIAGVADTLCVPREFHDRKCRSCVHHMIVRRWSVRHKPLQPFCRNSHALRDRRPRQTPCSGSAARRRRMRALLPLSPPACALQHLVKRTSFSAADRVCAPVPRTVVADDLPARPAPMPLDLKACTPKLRDRRYRIRALFDPPDAAPGKSAAFFVDPPHVAQISGLQALPCRGHQAIGAVSAAQQKPPFSWDVPAHGNLSCVQRASSHVLFAGLVYARTGGFERRLISERTCDGIAVARKRGSHHSPVKQFQRGRDSSKLE